MDKVSVKALLYVLSIYLFAFLAGYLISNLLDNNFEHNAQNISKTYISLNTFLKIFFNNIKVFIIILTGFFLLKIPTVINLVSNGATLGFFLGEISSDKLIEILPPLLIHGIPEITGFIIAAYLVFLGKEKFIENKKFNFNLLLFGILIIFIAAFLETYISPKFI